MNIDTDGSAMRCNRCGTPRLPLYGRTTGAIVSAAPLPVCVIEILCDDCLARESRTTTPIDPRPRGAEER